MVAVAPSASITQRRESRRSELPSRVPHRRARLDRVYRLDDSDKAELEQMRKSLEGQFAFVAGVIAARIHAYPAWQLDFFDDRQVRLDLTAQVTSIAAGAASLRDQRAVLGPPPAGHLGKDNHVIGVYIEKARVLDRRADGVLERLRAFAEYRAVVARIQEREEKRSWLDRVGAIDELDTAVDDVINQGETERLRAVAVDSELLSSLYLDTLEPLTASLTVAEMTNIAPPDSVVTVLRHEIEAVTRQSLPTRPPG